MSQKLSPLSIATCSTLSGYSQSLVLNIGRLVQQPLRGIDSDSLRTRLA